MTAREILQRLAVLDIRISANGDQLRVNAPQSVLTAELSAELAARKPEILSLLESSGRTRTSIGRHSACAEDSIAIRYWCRSSVRIRFV